MNVPTVDQIRAEAIDQVSLEMFNQKGKKAEGLTMVFEIFLGLMFKYFPLFCELARVENIRMFKELKDHGYKSSTKMIGGKVYEGSYGWSKDKNFQHKWIVPTQLMVFMRHINKDFWSDKNAKVRDKFMKGVLKGENYHELLNEVYKHHGSNIVTAITAEDRKAVGIS